MSVRENTDRSYYRRGFSVGHRTSDWRQAKREENMRPDLRQLCTHKKRGKKTGTVLLRWLDDGLFKYMRELDISLFKAVWRERSGEGEDDQKQPSHMLSHGC